MTESIRMRAARLRAGAGALAALLVLILAVASPVTASNIPPVKRRSLTVKPGDTLSGIAEAYGVSVTDLMRINALRHPRDLKAGQILSLPPLSVPGLVLMHVAWGDDVTWLARRSGLSVDELARINGLLNPRTVSLGTRLYGPPTVGAHPVRRTDSAPRLGAAIATGAPLWSVMRLNPQPIPAGEPVLVPDRPGSADVDAGQPSVIGPEVTDLQLTPQPVVRGQTAMVRLITEEPVSCTIRYLDRTEACYPSRENTVGNGAVTYAFVGLPALLAPGSHPLTLTIASDAGERMVPLMLRVAPGRFDYERIDLPPDRQSLLDPARTQAERETIAALRTVRSPERRWTLPFGAPLQGSITSYYGSRRSYGQGFSGYHAGADFQAATGVPVYAPASGTVILAEPLVIRGNAVMIDHGWGVTTGYWHLSRIDVSMGQEIEAGAQLGLVGNTGLSTGSHLHWELWVNGIAVDPLDWLAADPDSGGVPELTMPGGVP